MPLSLYPFGKNGYRSNPMRSNPTKRQQIADLWLTILAHIDAFRHDPAAYMTAAKWWLLRKRVRARGQLAPLLSQSPRAYRLWALREDVEGRAHSSHDVTPPIVALVETTGDESQLAITQLSLTAEGISAHCIGVPYAPDLAAAADAIDWNLQPWLMPIRAGDRIAPGAASAYRAAIEQATRPPAGEEGSKPESASRAPRVLFADDDMLDRNNRRADPHFKPDWNSELFVHHDYLTGACIVRATRADLAAAATAANAGGVSWAQILVAQGASAGPPIHLHKMLHHRRARLAPRLPAKPNIVSRDLPPVTIIVPTRNRLDLLRTCLTGVAAADYPQVEVIVVDNDSDDAETLSFLSALDPAQHRVVRHSGPFNYSAINNRAAALAQGRLLCLLNNDVEMIATDWLALMVRQALRPDVGAVGARLLYPDGRIQHAGVVIGVGNAAGHAHRLIRPDEDGYFRRHALPQFTTAVTAACLLVQRERFEAVGGLDERNFPVAFNDVDLCLRLNQRGWQSLYEPRATLVHHESVSRGFDKDPVGAARFAGELEALQRIWKTDHITDPFHHPQLSRASERFSVAF